MLSLSGQERWGCWDSAPSASGQLNSHNNLLTNANWSKKQNSITNIENKAQHFCLL